MKSSNFIDSTHGSGADPDLEAVRPHYVHAREQSALDAGFLSRAFPKLSPELSPSAYKRLVKKQLRNYHATLRAGGVSRKELRPWITASVIDWYFKHAPRLDQWELDRADALELDRQNEAKREAEARAWQKAKEAADRESSRAWRRRRLTQKQRALGGRRSGATRRRKRNALIPRVKWLRARGFSYRRIAAELGISASSALNYARLTVFKEVNTERPKEYKIIKERRKSGKEKAGDLLRCPDLGKHKRAAAAFGSDREFLRAFQDRLNAEKKEKDP